VITVALVGPDGAGKSTVSRLLRDASLPAPVSTLYMGVNLDEGGPMLPTSRLALVVKRWRGGRADMTVAPPRAPARQQNGFRRIPGTLRGAARMVLWVAEEWYRQLVASRHRLRGRIVVFDRHFFVDYYHHDVAATTPRSAASTLHGWLLRHVYPKPDLVICLDAPGEVLHRRKGEADPQWLEERRQQYLQLRTVVPNFAVVAADRPVDVVTRDVADTITRFCNARAA
jgi:thymidylate kinase